MLAKLAIFFGLFNTVLSTLLYPDTIYPSGVVNRRISLITKDHWHWLYNNCGLVKKNAEVNLV